MADIEELLRHVNPLIYHGIVGDMTGLAPNTFICEGLSGYGTGKFLGTLGNPYYIFVQRDVGGLGAAPQGEVQQITGYTSAGLFSHNAFSVNLTAGDEILVLHPAVVGAIPTASINQGLCYYGRVTAVLGNTFTVPTLAGLGSDKFCGGGAGHLNPYQVFVLRDDGGIHNAPQGEAQNITDYDTATGTFSHDAFTGALSAGPPGDEVLIIHPALAQVLVIAAALAVPAADAVTNTYMRDVIGNKTDTANTTVGLTSSLMRYVKGILNRVNAIFNQVNAIQVLTETGGSITTTAAELDIYRVETPLGVFKPISFKIDLTNMLAADDLTIRVYERIVTGGALVRSDVQNYAGVQTVEPVSPMKTITLDPNRFGFQITIDENGASGHVVCPWAITYES